jgi:hypothetical protein
MTPKLKDFLKTKLVETCLHLKKTEQNKKDSSYAFTKEIRGGRERINALSQAILEDSVEELMNVYGAEYVSSLEEYAEKL